MWPTIQWGFLSCQVAKELGIVKMGVYLVGQKFQLGWVLWNRTDDLFSLDLKALLHVVWSHYA